MSAVSIARCPATVGTDGKPSLVDWLVACANPTRFEATWDYDPGNVTVNATWDGRCRVEWTVDNLTHNEFVASPADLRALLDRIAVEVAS